MDVVGGPPYENRYAHRRNDGQNRRNGALPRRSPVEFAFESPNIADECPLRTGAPAERMPLLEAKRSEDREQVHRMRKLEDAAT